MTVISGLHVSTRVRSVPVLCRSSCHSLSGEEGLPLHISLRACFLSNVFIIILCTLVFCLQVCQIPWNRGSRQLLVPCGCWKLNQGAMEVCSYPLSRLHPYTASFYFFTCLPGINWLYCVSPPQPTHTDLEHIAIGSALFLVGDPSGRK